MLGTVISAGVDFLTGTTKTDERTSSLMHYLIREIWPSEGQLPLVGSWGSHGFHGRGIANAKWGIRGEEGIVQLSGDIAQRLFPTVSSLCDSITRIDFQVTVRLSEQYYGVAADAYAFTRGEQRLKTALIQNSDRGSTCYVGSRSSRWYGRIYDKGAQKGREPGQDWRFEVEIKKPAAHLECDRLSASVNKDEFITGYVYEWFRARGIVPHFTPTSAISAIELPKDLTNEQKVLQWLHKQVRPAVGKLVNNGFSSEVYEALGLPEPHSLDLFRQFQEDI